VPQQELGAQQALGGRHIRHVSRRRRRDLVRATAKLVLAIREIGAKYVGGTRRRSRHLRVVFQ